MYWVCMSSTYLTYCSYRRCDRDWLPPTWAYTVLASSPTGISKATGFPCLPSFTSSPFLSPDWPVSKRACTVANLLRPHAAVPLFCPPTHTLGKTKESERKKTLYSTAHTPDITTHTHTHRTPAKIAIHPSIHSLYGHPHRVPWSQSLHCTPPLPHETCFLTPHSALSAPSSALLAPVHHDNNRRRLFTHRGNPLAMHRSGTLPQHSSLGRS
jgi:hypothetical protein